jgi:predicted nucleotidyltransferase
MKVLAIIAEYNPFHKGHLYHLNNAIKLIQPDFTIAIMSGNFTQRGEPTIIDKWARTRMALENGIHLVLELPTLYACQTAEVFAAGAVEILHQTDLVTHIAFGSEYHNLKHLNIIAEILAEEPLAYKRLLKSGLNQGLSFPAARLRAIQQYIRDIYGEDKLPSQLIERILKGSNSILAIEYLKALMRLKSTIQPVIIPRVGSSYNTEAIEGQYSSATAIRKSILSGEEWACISHTLPSVSLKILKDSINRGRGPVSINSFDQLLLGMLRQAPFSEIASWMDVEEGLENRIKRFAQKCTSIQDFLLETKTKRYTYTRLQRILIHGLLGIKTQDVIRFHKNGGPSYIRILGFNTEATPLLSKLKKTSNLPIITKPAHYYRYGLENINIMFEYEILATDLYVMAFPNPDQRKGGQELTQDIVRI